MQLFLQRKTKLRMDSCEQAYYLSDYFHIFQCPQITDQILDEKIQQLYCYVYVFGLLLKSKQKKGH